MTVESAYSPAWTEGLLWAWLRTEADSPWERKPVRRSASCFCSGVQGRQGGGPPSLGGQQRLAVIPTPRCRAVPQWPRCARPPRAPRGRGRDGDSWADRERCQLAEEPGQALPPDGWPRAQRPLSPSRSGRSVAVPAVTWGRSLEPCWCVLTALRGSCPGPRPSGACCVNAPHLTLGVSEVGGGVLSTSQRSRRGSGPGADTRKGRH